MPVNIRGRHFLKLLDYSPAGQTSVMEYKGILLNITDMSLEFQGKKTELSKNEFKILQVLFEKAGGTVSRENIMKKLWDDECFVDDNTLTVNINRLRKKLEGEGIRELIVTKKGVGYQLGGMEDGDKKR